MGPHRPGRPAREGRAGPVRRYDVSTVLADRLVAVGRLPDDVHQRDPPAPSGVRRVPPRRPRRRRDEPAAGASGQPAVEPADDRRQPRAGHAPGRRHAGDQPPDGDGLEGRDHPQGGRELRHRPLPALRGSRLGAQRRVRRLSNPVQIIPRDTFVPGLPGCFWTGQEKITSNPVRYIVNAAFDGLGTWAQGGSAPPAGAQISSPTPANNGSATRHPAVPPYPACTARHRRRRVDQINRDALGNAVGGVRTPFVDAASRAYKPISLGPLAAFCSLTGRETRSPRRRQRRTPTGRPSSARSTRRRTPRRAPARCWRGDRASARRLALQSYTIRPDAPTVTSGTSPSRTGRVHGQLERPEPGGPRRRSRRSRYDLQRRDADDADWTSVATGLTTRSYTFTSGTPESEGTVRYRVRVKAVQTPPQHLFNAPITLSSDWSATSPDVVVDKTAPARRRRPRIVRRSSPEAEAGSRRR